MPAIDAIAAAESIPDNSLTLLNPIVPPILLKIYNYNSYRNFVFVTNLLHPAVTIPDVAIHVK
jgi:hypothetical protein